MNPNLKHMPLISPFLTPLKQKEIFNVGDTVIVRPDALKYFIDVVDEMLTDLGKERKIISIQEIGPRYGNDAYEESILNPEIHNPEDLLITLEDLGGGEWFWYYRCFFIPKLAVPNYTPKRKILESSHFEEIKKTNYFSKYNAFIITLNVNDEDFKKLKSIGPMLSEVFDVNIWESWIDGTYNGAKLDKCEEIYIAIRSTSSIGSDTQEFLLGWGSMDYLPTTTYDYRSVYPKPFTLNQIDTQGKIESILRTGTISPSYIPRKKVLENLNESVKDSYYFMDNDAFAIVLNKDMDDLSFDDLRKNLIEIFKIEIPEPLLDYANNQVEEEKFFIIIYRKDDKINWTWSEYSYLYKYIEERKIVCNTTYEFNYNDVSTKQKIRNILNSGKSTPSYEPRRRRMLENLNESSVKVLISNYYTKNNSLIITIDKNITEEHYIEFTKMVNDVFGMDIMCETLYAEMQDYIKHSNNETGCFFNIHTNIHKYFNGKDFHMDWDILSYLDEYKIKYNTIGNTYDYKKINTKDKLESIIKYGQAMPSYKPKRKVLEKLNESIIDALNSNYYAKNNSLLITIDKNVTEEQYIELARIVNGIFGYHTMDEYIYDWIQEYIASTNETGYWVNIEKYADRVFVSEWDKISYLQEYIRSYDITGNTYSYDQVNTKQKIEAILKYNQSTPNYKPKRKVLENLNEEYDSKLRDEVSSTFYFTRYNSIIVTFYSDIEKVEYDRIKELLEYATRVELPYYHQLLRNEEQFYFVIKINKKENEIYSGWGRISDFKRENEFLETCTYPKIFKSNEVDTETKINDILKYGQSTPSYAPKRKVLEKLNESFEDLKNSKYFTENNTIVILYDKNTPKKIFDNVRNTINNVFGNDFFQDFLYNYAIRDCRENEGYFTIELEYDKFDRGFCYISYLPEHKISHRLKYNRTFRMNDVDTKIKLDHLLKHGQSAPSYAPRRKFIQ